MNIVSSQSESDIKTDTTDGSLHTLVFENGQTITVNDVNSNVMIQFHGGGSENV